MLWNMRWAIWCDQTGKQREWGHAEGDALPFGFKHIAKSSKALATSPSDVLALGQWTLNGLAVALLCRDIASIRAQIML